MNLLVGVLVVLFVAFLATWVNDNVPVGEYIDDGQPGPS